MGNAVKQQPTVVSSTSDSAGEAKKTRTPPPPPAPEGEKEELATRFGLAGGGARPTRTDAENDTTSSGVGSLNPEEEMSGVATTATTATATIEDPEKPEVVEAATRLRSLLDQLERGESIDSKDLKASLTCAVAVLENSAKPEQTVEELPEVTREAVPDQVRDWLASTFTSKAQASVRRRSGGAIKHLRGVVHAVRWNIKMDKVYKQVVGGVSYPVGVKDHFQNLDEWTYDVFELDKLTGGQPLRFVGLELFKRHDLLTKFKVNQPTLDAFLQQIEAGYKKHGNSYHNATHAADVLHGIHSLLWKTGIKRSLSELEVFASLVAAIIHDFEHTGTTNSFHVQCRSEMALLYNDKSVLENHHLSAAFHLMQRSDFNVLSGLSAEDYKEFRALVIEMVLATDMSAHFQMVKSMKALVTAPDVTPDSVDKPKALSMMLHSCDIGHPCKEWPLHETWTKMLIEEFFQQGDREKEMDLPSSPLCDRNATLVPESQVGFINFIVMPSLEVLRDLLDVLLQPESEEEKRGENSTQQQQQHKSWIECLLKNCAANVERWKSQCGKPKSDDSEPRDSAASPAAERAKDRVNVGAKKPESGKVLNARPRLTGHQRSPVKPPVLKQSSNKSMKEHKAEK